MLNSCQFLHLRCLFCHHFYICYSFHLVFCTHIGPFDYHFPCFPLYFFVCCVFFFQMWFRLCLLVLILLLLMLLLSVILVLVVLFLFFIANIFRCKIYLNAAMCINIPKASALDTFSQFNSRFRFHILFAWLCVLFCFVNESRQFINIKFCSALFSIQLQLELFCQQLLLLLLLFFQFVILFSLANMLVVCSLLHIHYLSVWYVKESSWFESEVIKGHKSYWIV